MFIVGVAFLLFWIIVEVFVLTIAKAALMTAVIFLILGLLMNERPWEKRP